jgi:hypothetical protein
MIVGLIDGNQSTKGKQDHLYRSVIVQAFASSQRNCLDDPVGLEAIGF